MGINPTQPNHKAFTFDGTSSRDYGVYITGEAVFNAPQRDVQMVDIPGRNGAYALDKGNFNNITVKYPASIVADNETDFAEAVSDLRNFLCSKTGYCRLEDEYNPDEYRMAIYKSGLEVEHDMLIAGEFDITFECKPQRWLTSGEELITIGEWRDVQTAEGAVATFEADSATRIKSLTVDIDPIQDLHGYDSPWVGGAGVNKWDEEWEVGSINTSTGQNASGSDTVRSKNYIPVIAESSYYLLCSLGGVRVYYYDSTKAFMSSVVVTGNSVTTIPTGASYIRFRIGSANAPVTSLTAGDVAINYPSSITTYSPWQNICPISGRNSVRVYQRGGNLFDSSQPLLNGYLNSSGEVKGTSGITNKHTYKIRIKGGDVYTIARSINNTTGESSCWYDENETFISASALPANTSQATFTAPENACYVAFTFYNVDGQKYCFNAGNTANVNATYNGTTYTTSLGTTVYGGTLDVVSGELTVTHIIDTFNGDSITEIGTASGVQYARVLASELASGASGFRTRMKSNMYVSSASATSGNIVWASDSQKVVRIYDNRFTDLTTAQGILNATPCQLYYEVATPTTVQLTAQQVQTLLGTNNIFADSGDVTVEYGQNPMVLVNPTLFDARPQLQVYGYGTIDVGGSEIEVENVPIGEVQVATQTATSAVPISQTLDVTALENGDTFTVSKAEAHMNYSSASALSFGMLSAYVMTNCSAVMTWALENSKEVLKFDIYVDDNSFSKGTAKTNTFSVTGPIIANGGQVSITISGSIVYDGSSSLTYNITATAVANTSQAKSAKGPDIFGVSSKPLASTIYIDLDTGEAYNIISGTPISVNSLVHIPPELPTLPSGDTTITFDNTFTQVDIVPRWWKV